MSDAPIFINSYEPGYHGADLAKTVGRLDREGSWKDLSTVIVTPAGNRRIEGDGRIVVNGIAPKVVASWTNLAKPPNGRVVDRLWAVGAEVGAAYSQLIEGILAHPDMGSWKYLLCIEHDNMPPWDGLIRLQKQMEDHPEFAAIGGLYFTKGIGGVAQIWGNPAETPMSFRPQRPDPNGGLVECNGTGMGFTMFRLQEFRNPKLRRPWFVTPPNATQDLYFWNDARLHGYRCAVDCSIKVGHYDIAGDMVW